MRDKLDPIEGDVPEPAAMPRPGDPVPGAPPALEEDDLSDRRQARPPDTYTRPISTVHRTLSGGRARICVAGMALVAAVAVAVMHRRHGRGGAGWGAKRG